MSSYVLPGTGAGGGYQLPGVSAPAAGPPATHSSFLGTVMHDIASPVEHIAKSVGETAIGIPLGFYTVGKTALLHPSQLPKLAEGVVKYYENAYSGSPSEILHKIWANPAPYALDALMVVSGGLTGAAKLGEAADIARLASLSKPAELVTRSPKGALEGGSATQDITRLTSGKPIVKLRQQAIHKLSRAIDDVLHRWVPI